MTSAERTKLRQIVQVFMSDDEDSFTSGMKLLAEMAGFGNRMDVPSDKVGPHENGRKPSYDECKSLGDALTDHIVSEFLAGHSSIVDRYFDSP